jgi:hypothetical protein
MHAERGRTPRTRVGGTGRCLSPIRDRARSGSASYACGRANFATRCWRRSTVFSMLGTGMNSRTEWAL